MNWEAWGKANLLIAEASISRIKHQKRWINIFIVCILWQTAVAFTYGMKWVNEQHVNTDLSAQVRALKEGCHQ